jgi:hypothetical protein
MRQQQPTPASRHNWMQQSRSSQRSKGRGRTAILFVGWRPQLDSTTVLTPIKDDVNKLQENTRGLQSHRSVASAWQQDAIDRVTSLANDLATNMNRAMDHLNKNKTRPTAPPYPEYLKANTQIANALAEEIDGIIDYGENKEKMGELEKKLPE